MAPATEPEDQGEQGSSGSQVDFGDHLDMSTFEQILQMDDDEETRDFSQELVSEFCTQVVKTMTEMDDHLNEKNLKRLGDLGHFLKGSSATLGLTKVKDSCEKIQNLGSRKDETGSREGYDDETSLAKIKSTKEQLEKDFNDARNKLREFYTEATF